MAEITQLLAQMKEGSRQAADEVMRRMYNELHRLAVSYMRRERSDHTLQATALVNEAYLRLAGLGDVEWQSREHFLALAAQTMRRVLVDHARARVTARRGGVQRKVSLDDPAVVTRSRSADLVAVDEALSALARVDARQSQIVELRFFGGLTEEETAEVLGVSSKTVHRDWLAARAWLHAYIAECQ